MPEEKKTIKTTETTEQTPVKEKVKEQPKPKETKPRAPKARKVEELVELSTSKMTDKEKDILIKYLKESLLGADNRAEQYKKNCETAFQKLSRANEEYQAMEAYYKNSLGYINQQMVAFSQAVSRATVGGTN